MTYILLSDWNDALRGTWFTLMGGLYWYETINKYQSHVPREFVEASDMFRQITALEMLYHVEIK